MNLISFFGDHTKYFSTKWMLVQYEGSCHVTEVGCKCLFGLVVIFHHPHRPRLGERNYEGLEMFASILNVVYIDPEWVAKEYLRCCKKENWKDESNKEVLKCWNLEHLIEVETFGLPVPDESTIDALLNEDQERAGGSGNLVVFLDH
ncbi:hypothetical protein ACHAW6_002656 [Cyclotella cf. meneghiniana]